MNVTVMPLRVIWVFQLRKDVSEKDSIKLSSTRRAAPEKQEQGSEKQKA
jgi:hypothetical protein